MNRTTQKEAILELFKLHDGKVTLAQILKTPLAAEYRARFSEMRQVGYIIDCKKGDVPSENTYTLIEPEASDTLTDTTPPQSAENAPIDTLESKSVEHHRSKLDRINRKIAPDTIKGLIKRCNEVLAGYPPNHPQRPDIEAQVEELRQR